MRRFVLLLQELYRRGSDVPAFPGLTRSAHAIRPRDPQAPDARDYAHALDLSMLYVPSMRNGEAMLEDRGNAILSTEPLDQAFARNCPERQRRDRRWRRDRRAHLESGVRQLHFVNVHLGR